MRKGLTILCIVAIIILMAAAGWAAREDDTWTLTGATNGSYR